MVQDFLLDDDMDMLIQGGDQVIGPSDDQHNQGVIIATPGMIRCSPITGVGIFRRLKGRFGLKESDTLKQDIQLQFQADGCTSTKIVINSTIDFNADGTR
jgi:hypothetical protein